MQKVITKDGREYQIEIEYSKQNEKNKNWCLSFLINNDSSYDICATKKLIKFGWTLEDKIDDIKGKLEKIGFEKLKERLENNNWGGCEKLEGGNYREVLDY